MSSSSPQSAPRAFYLQSDTPPAFAFFHPGSEARRRRAVLLCPPFGWEDMCSYRSRRDWAEHLAQRGYPALRIDLPGSGDSAGGPTDTGQLETWTRALDGAARWLLDSGGVEQIVSIGIGLGGMLACRAAMNGAPIDELVLWHVPAQGRTLVRELRAFAALEVAYIPGAGTSAPDPTQEPLEDGAIVANGYLLNAETVSELERLDLRELAHTARRARRVLLLGRDGLKVDERLREALDTTGAAVTLADGVGYGAMMIEPQDARPPIAVFELVDSWLAAGETDTSPPDIEAPEPLAAESPSASPRRSVAHESIELTCAGVELRETPLHVDGPDGPLFGILTEPLASHRELSAVLMNAGPQRRTGPNRMWVEIARRWAARGVPTLRFDLAGIGDSDGDAAALAQVASLYTPAFVGQARAVLDALAARGLPQRFLALGLCAGAYWSTHTALEDERIGTVIMLNPRTLVWDQWVYGVRRASELRKKLLLSSTWRKVLHGEITLARHLETAGALASRATRSPRRVRERLTGSRGEDSDRGAALAGIFDGLRDRDQEVLLLFTGSEPLHRDLAALGILDRLEDWPNMETLIRGTSADTHTLTPLWLQRQVHELVDEALERELERLPDGEEAATC